MSEFSFFIVGKPAPGGSKTAFALRRKGGGLVLRPGGAPVINITDAGGEANKKWKAAVTIQGRGFMKGARPFNEALKVEFIFFLKRPGTHYRTGKFSHMLRDDAPPWHVTKPDALKYARSTEDALTGVLWQDDSANVRICSEKRYMAPGDKEGCAVRFVLLRSTPPAVTQPAGQ